jgi:broad specificity phosphatase PhoE
MSISGLTIAATANQRLRGLIALAASEPLPLETGRFFFLRHGETDGNRLRVIQPVTQPLNQNGMEQAARAAAILSRHAISGIAASDLHRCRQTAGIVSERVAKPLRFVPDLREKSFGDWVGQPSHELDWDTVPPNGESLADFVGRTRRGLVDAVRDEESGLVIAHGGTLYVLASGLGLDVSRELIANATPLLFERRNGVWHAQILAVVGDPSASVPS